MFKKILKIARNKYFIVGLVAIIWIVFFDDHNLLSQINTKKELNNLEQKKTYYQDEISQDKEMLYKIKSDTSFMQAYGRKKYLMKKDNEEIFLIIRSEEDYSSYTEDQL